MALLELDGLGVRLGRREVVRDVSLAVEPGQIYGVAGESGSGKTITMLALLGLLPRGGRATGAARLDGLDLLGLDRAGLLGVRGRQVGMVFQDPTTALHPMLTVGAQLTEHARRHLGLGKEAALRRAAELLEQVRIPDPDAALQAYPHQFSGGMRQRIAIAGALICEPKLLIADEPTTALDVTVQAGILRLLDRLRRETGLAVVLITHDLGVMRSVAERISVLYAGRVVEAGAAPDVLAEPRHPYTRGLLAARPRGSDEPLVAIPGTPADPADPPPGCPFHPRCPLAVDACRAEVPPLVRVAGREVACPVTSPGGSEQAGSRGAESGGAAAGGDRSGPAGSGGTHPGRTEVSP